MLFEQYSLYYRNWIKMDKSFTVWIWAILKHIKHINLFSYKS